MPNDHVVQQGEHLSSIAEKHGFADYKIIWDDAANAALREKRKNPHVLFLGDVVKIPDRVDKKEPAETKAILERYQPFLFCVFHSRLTGLRGMWREAPKLRAEQIKVLVSSHRDGVMIARAAELQGFGR